MRSGPYHWHIISPEFPPQIGGVGDYSRQAAEELRALGDSVDIWYPGAPGLAAGFSPSGLSALSAHLDSSPAPRRLFVQWVPHGYGYKSMNLPFALWLYRRARAGDRIDLMVHEPFLMFREGSWKQDAVAMVHRVMMSFALASASHVWMSIPQWEKRLQFWFFGRKTPLSWLPVPSNLRPSKNPPLQLNEYFAQATSRQGPLLGHFGTGGKHIAALLRRIIPVILEKSETRVLLLGLGSDAIAESFGNPRVVGLGTQPEETLSRAIAACDAMLQPYTDGVSTRRGSAMAALIHGKALATTSGPATEGIWKEEGLADLSPANEPEALAEAVLQLLHDRDLRENLGRRAAAGYLKHFTMSNSMQRLRDTL